MRIKAVNPWGKTLEAQRHDLWVVDLREPIQVISATYANLVDSNLVARLNRTHQFFATTISFPELAVAAEPYRRDSRPYNFPSWDNPASQVKISFLHEVGETKVLDIRRSAIYQFLDLWRASVRSGRGAMSTESGVTLTSTFQAFPFRFDVSVRFLSGIPNDDMTEADMQGDQNISIELGGGGGVEVSAVYVLKNMWLSSFQQGEISYTGGSHAHVINAAFYVDDVLQL